MQARSDLVIVSAFGRGNAVAQELAKRGMGVSLVDVSDQLGRWTPEDWAGPFGYFEDGVSQFTRDVDYVEAKNGFTIWLPNRVLEMRGPLTEFSLARMGVTPQVIKFLQESHLPAGGLLRKELEQQSFDKNWLAHFAQQFSSNVFLDNFKSLESHYCRPLSRKFYLRRTNREKIIQSFRDCFASGVRVFTNARILDVSIVNQRLDAIEISSERSGVLTGNQFVWMLSSEESDVFPERVRQRLYPKGAIESAWCWVRFSYHLPESHETSVLPEHFVMLKDYRLPWTHSHCALVQRAAQPNQYDFWLRIPSKRRFQRTFLDEQGAQILSELKARLPGASPVLLERPAEYMVSHKELGAPRFQVYSEGHLKSLKRLQLANLAYCGPEEWTSLDINGQEQSYRLLTSYLIDVFKSPRRQQEEDLGDRPLHPS